LSTIRKETDYVRPPIPVLNRIDALPWHCGGSRPPLPTFIKFTRGGHLRDTKQSTKPRLINLTHMTLRSEVTPP
jgi:hypothetical protein